MSQHNPDEYISRKFRSWTLIGYAGTKGRMHNYNVKCECGTERIYSIEALRVNRVKENCGCKAKTSEEICNNNVWLQYKHAASKRSLEFSITKEEFANLIHNECYYCGEIGSNLHTTPHHSMRYNGIDRLQNALGYQTGNVVSCCKHCNFIKNTTDVDEFLRRISDIYVKRILNG
jgi:hypothetical protein